MCGIFGFVGRIKPETAKACTDSLAHRGPDGGGLLHRPDVTLGHRRLAILDLSDAGRQPMTSPDGRYTIVYNGEIYNFLELRARLTALGRSFKSESDTEVLLAAYAQWGPECLPRCNGMWAMAVWDDAEKTLFLARDRFGKKPLFHARTQSGFAFASEMKALFPLLPQIRPNEELVRDSSRIMYYEATPECLVRGVTRFPAGHWGVWRKGELDLRRWWHTLDHLPESPKSFNGQAKRFRELFLDACSLRLRSDVPVGCALSGGLDSSSTLAGVARAARTKDNARGSENWQHAFCASFKGTPLEERPFAERMAAHVGVPLTSLEIDPAANLGNLYRHLRLFEEMHLTMPLPFILTYGAIREQNIRVSIDGHGADECFAGYMRHVREALACAGKNPSAISSIIKAWFRGFPRSPQFPLPRPRRFLMDYRREHRRSPEVRSKDADHPAWRGLDHLGKALYVAVHESILPTLLRNYDRFSMANGVEIRMPFMDHRLVILSFSLPWRSKVRGGFSKAVVRRGMSGMLPREIAYRPTKIGFNAPIVDWMRGPFREFFLDTLASPDFRQCSLVDADRASRRVAAVLDNPLATYAEGERAWTSVVPYFWEQALIKGKDTP